MGVEYYVYVEVNLNLAFEAVEPLLKKHLEDYLCERGKKPNRIELERLRRGMEAARIGVFYEDNEVETRNEALQLVKNALDEFVLKVCANIVKSEIRNK